MVQLNKHPILWQCAGVIDAIEECGASEKLTAAVIKAGNLTNAVEKLVDETTTLRADNAELLKALKSCKRMIDLALPEFNWKASALSADAIKMLNLTPIVVNFAITKCGGDS